MQGTLQSCMNFYDYWIDAVLKLFYMKIGEVIVNLRKDSRLKQKELATAIGISATYLSQIEHNLEKPSIIVLSKIADYFNLPLSAIIFKTISSNEIDNMDQKRRIKAAEPVINALIKYLLPSDESIRGKDPLAGNKANRKKLKA